MWGSTHQGIPAVLWHQWPSTTNQHTDSCQHTTKMMHETATCGIIVTTAYMYAFQPSKAEVTKSEATLHQAGDSVHGPQAQHKSRLDQSA
jgi:hypothetical protein